MTEPQQSFQNHARIIPAYHYFVFGALSINLVQSALNLFGAPSFRTVSGVLTAAALIVLAFYARVFALKAQDRAIRLEMRLRMKELLPPAQQQRINEFTPRQLVAMRFASDAELPDLSAKVLADNVQDSKTIKRMIKDWQGDYLRV
jgi:hypothetical protein